jgi:hypothetical protein
VDGSPNDAARRGVNTYSRRSPRYEPSKYAVAVAGRRRCAPVLVKQHQDSEAKADVEWPDWRVPSALGKGAVGEEVSVSFHNSRAALAV